MTGGTQQLVQDWTRRNPLTWHVYKEFYDKEPMRLTSQ